MVRLHVRPLGKLETLTPATGVGGGLYRACAPTAALEIEIAQSLRRLSPTVSPNPHLIALADSILSRQGRMVRGERVDRTWRRSFRGRKFP